MFPLIYDIRYQDREMNHYSSEFLERETRATVIGFPRAAQYIRIFMAVWIPLLIVAFVFEFGVQLSFVILLLDAICIPAVGYLNEMVEATNDCLFGVPAM